MTKERRSVFSTFFGGMDNQRLGSSGVDGSDNLKSAFEREGFNVNSSLWDFIPRERAVSISADKVP